MHAPAASRGLSVAKSRSNGHPISNGREHTVTITRRLLTTTSVALIAAAVTAGPAWTATRHQAGAALTTGSPAWSDALNARSEALNDQHGLGSGTHKRGVLGTPGPGWREALVARSDVMNRRYGLGDDARASARSSSTPDWLAALNARSDALDKLHGLGEHAARRAPAGGERTAAAVVGRERARLPVGPTTGAGMLGVGAASAEATSLPAVRDAVTRPDDRGDARGPGVYFTVPAVATAAIATDSFEWGDASAGAGAMLMAILLAAGVAVSIRHRGRTILP